MLGLVFVLCWGSSSQALAYSTLSNPVEIHIHSSYGGENAIIWITVPSSQIDASLWVSNAPFNFNGPFTTQWVINDLPKNYLYALFDFLVPSSYADSNPDKPSCLQTGTCNAGTFTITTNNDICKATDTLSVKYCIVTKTLVSQTTCVSSSGCEVESDACSSYVPQNSSLYCGNTPNIVIQNGAVKKSILGFPRTYIMKKDVYFRCGTSPREILKTVYYNEYGGYGSSNTNTYPGSVTISYPNNYKCEQYTNPDDNEPHPDPPNTKDEHNPDEYKKQFESPNGVGSDSHPAGTAPPNGGIFAPALICLGNGCFAPTPAPSPPPSPTASPTEQPTNPPPSGGGGGIGTPSPAPTDTGGGGTPAPTGTGGGTPAPTGTGGGSPAPTGTGGGSPAPTGSGISINPDCPSGDCSEGSFPNASFGTQGFNENEAQGKGTLPTEIADTITRFKNLIDVDITSTGGQCSFPVDVDFFGYSRTGQLDFCQFSEIFDIIGYFVFSIAGIYAIIIVFGKGG